MAQGRLSERLSRAWLPRFAVRGRVLAANSLAARERPRDALRYLFRSNEVSNFTYELDNMDDVSATVSEALAVSPDEANRALDELADDAELRAALTALLRENPKRDSVPRYGYRYMYYCAARLVKPAVAVEVGTHDGLGAALISRALERNESEGTPGKLITLDAASNSGWLIPPNLRSRCEVVLGDVMQTLPKVIEEHGCDFLVDDIGFGFTEKPWVFETGIKLGRRPLTIGSEFPPRQPGDPQTALEQAARGAGGRYSEFIERPKDHFWPGHTLGLAQIPPT